MGTSPRYASLFSGIGGGDLGAQILGWDARVYVEKEEFCQKVLKRRMQEGWIDEAPIWDDVQTFPGTEWRGEVDVLTAGFPCQPFSIAGNQKAGEDERNLWPATKKQIRDIRPRIAFLENVPNLVRGGHGYYGRVLGDLSEIGYNAIWDIISASASCAPHRRERLWVLAWDSDADRTRLRRIAQFHRQSVGGERLQRGGYTDGFCDEVADVERTGLEGHRSDGDAGGASGTRGAGDRHTGPEGSGRGDEKRQSRAQWFPEPDVGRLADGIPDRVDRLRALGNAQVPQQMALAFALLSRRMCQFLDEEE